jgi:hypothetical protein
MPADGLPDSGRGITGLAAPAGVGQVLLLFFGTVSAPGHLVTQCSKVLAVEVGHLPRLAQMPDHLIRSDLVPGPRPG